MQNDLIKYNNSKAKDSHNNIEICSSENNNSNMISMTNSNYQ